MLNLMRLIFPVALILSSVSGASATVCGQHKVLVEALGLQYQERQRALGLSRSGALIEIYASEEGTWTILLITPDGAACILTDGEAWQEALPDGPAV